MRESAVIRAVRLVGVPAPEVIWAEFIAGCPVLVTRFMAGRVVLEPDDPHRWSRDLAATLAAIHGATVDECLRHRLIDAPPGPAEDVDEAAVRRHPRGEDLLEIRRALQPGRRTAATLVHGDYHPGNVLWRERSISAVLDWEAARLGDPACDVAYCSNELRLLGRHDLAEAFSSAYRDLSDRTIGSLPYWTVTALCRAIGDLEAIVRSWAALDIELSPSTARRHCDRMIEQFLTA